MKKQFTILLILISFAGFSQDFNTYWSLVESNNKKIKVVQISTQWETIVTDNTHKIGDGISTDWYLKKYSPNQAQYEQYVKMSPFTRNDTVFNPTRQFVKVIMYDLSVEYRQLVKCYQAKEVELSSNEQFEKWIKYCVENNVANQYIWQVGDSILNK